MKNIMYRLEEYKKDVAVYVDGYEYKVKDLFLAIPNGYKHLFDGKTFDSVNSVAKAVSFAKSAFEARMHNRLDLVRQYEVSLSSYVN